ncbi:alpha/beta fold hydrolase [Fulvivirga sp. RKSG066]|nr:alpha/beta fold hydrolase [Fulvivirga aurantia]
MLHGSIENGRIFYSKSGKGLAPYLAKQGFDVYVADLRGRGNSEPAIDKGHTYNQTDAILGEIPAFLNEIDTLKKGMPIHALAHSWGGVLLLSYIARFNDARIRSMVFFGTKRRIKVINWDRIWRVQILWNKIGHLLIAKHGYLPAVKYGFGSDNEPKEFYRQVKEWAIRGPWIDEQDGFDYANILQNKTVPPTLYLTGANDTHLGHPKDVKRLMLEVGNKPSDTIKIIGKANGYAHNYDHINLLTHPLALNDHFPEVVQWLRKHE